ncbi:pyrimidine dimer DNA glycosylase/endonuclease V [Photobacterium japonica]|uniref:pyrimidine dimer DNA glycosylase/endonuclease V n=1 Tax=Photobacterium japonica TaxID=2910235 RepID=UPI003D0A27D9
MNIFILDDDIQTCAQAHCDQHVVKMILESVQLLCTALNKKGFETPYKSTHPKHPCVLWVEASYDNFLWLRDLALALNDEYKYRYNKQGDHKSIAVLAEIADCRFPSHGLTPFAQAMPDEYKVDGDPITAYRRFYLGDKSAFAKWTKRSPPPWYSQAQSA